MSEILDNLRAKYPQYDEIPDADLAFRITEKYPEYKETDLLKDAMPARAEAFGEIRAAPSRAKMLGQETVGHVKNLLGGFREEESVLGDAARRLGAAGGLVGMPFRAAGQAAGAAFEPIAPHLPGINTPQEAERQVRALEGSVEWAPQIATGVRGAAALGAKLGAPRAAKVAPRPASAPTTPVKPGFTEEGFAPYTQEWDPLPPGHPLRPVEPIPKTTPMDTGEAGRITLGQASFLGRTAAGGLLGQEAGDTAIDKIRYGAAGAAVGAVVNPHLVVKGIRAMRTPTGLIGPSAVAKSAAKWKAKIGGFTPLDVGRGLPQATNLVEDAFAADDVANMLRQGYADELDAAFKTIHYDARSARHIAQSLDGAAMQLNPAEQAVAQRVAQVYQQMAQNSGTPVVGKLSDIFKGLRAPNQGWQFSMNDLMNDVRAVSKKVSVDGGTMPNGTVVDSFAKRGLQSLAQMKKDGYPDEVVAYYTQYLSDLTKGPTMSKLNILTPVQAARIKNVEFMRTIGLNVGSAVSNGLQQMNTFAKVSPGSFMKGYYDLFDARIMALAKREGVVSEVLAKADLESFASPTKFDAMLKHGTAKTGFLFARVEQMNRLHAFAAGLRDAEKSGLTGPAAVKYAKRLVNETQFRFGPENAPAMLRGGNPMASVLGQYKAYQIQQTLFLKNLILHDPKGLVKYLAGVTAIAGPDAITGHHIGDTIRGQLSTLLGGDPKDYKFRGLLGEAGIALGQQVGLGALPIENLSSLAFLIPGPALSHIIDTASLVLNRDLSPQAATRGKFGERLTPDQWAGLATRFGSVELDKIRRAVREYRSGQVVQESRNLGEAVAGPGTGSAQRPAESPWKIAAGIKDPDTEAYGTSRQEVGERAGRWNELVKKKAEAMANGDIEEVLRLNKLGQREFGRLPIVKGSTVKSARERQRTPALERQLRAAPKPLRGQLRKEAED